MWQGGDCPAYSQRDKTECIGNRGKGSCLHKHLGARERKHRARRPHCKSVQHDCHSEPYRAGQGDRADSGRVRFVIRLQRRPPPSPLMTRGSPSILMPGMLLLYIQLAHCSAGATYAKPPVFAVRESGLVRFAKPGPRFERKPADKRARSCTSQRPHPRNAALHPGSILLLFHGGLRVLQWRRQARARTEMLAHVGLMVRRART